MEVQAVSGGAAAAYWQQQLGGGEAGRGVFSRMPDMEMQAVCQGGGGGGSSGSSKCVARARRGNQ